MIKNLKIHSILEALLLTGLFYVQNIRKTKSYRFKKRYR